MLITILLTLLIFGVIILIHEMGHFIAAKLSGVQVNEFSLGMGPKLWQYQKKKPVQEEGGEDAPEPTKYSLRAFFVGGYVKMEGEDDESSHKNAFCNKSVWKRIFIVVAGALMNFVLGFLILFFLFLPKAELGTTTVHSFKEDATSVQYGLQERDQILSVNGHKVWTYQDAYQQIMSDDDGTMSFVVKRDGQKITLDAVTFHTEITDTERSLDFDFVFLAVENNPWETLKYTGGEFVYLAKMIGSSLVDLVTGAVSFSELSGPIGVGQVINEAVAVSMESVILLAAFLTINVGIFNLLPLPALDGGRFLFLLIEAVIRRPINPKYENLIHGIGFLLLLALIVFVTFQDVVRLFTA